MDNIQLALISRQTLTDLTIVALYCSLPFIVFVISIVVIILIERWGGITTTLRWCLWRAGLVAGIVLALYDSRLAINGLNGLFVAGSPWHVSLLLFWQELVNPLRYPFENIWPEISTRDPRLAGVLLLGVVILIIIGSFISALRHTDAYKNKLRLLAATFLLFALHMIVGFYLVRLIGWMVAWASVLAQVPFGGVWTPTKVAIAALVIIALLGSGGAVTQRSQSRPTIPRDTAQRSSPRKRMPASGHGMYSYRVKLERNSFTSVEVPAIFAKSRSEADRIVRVQHQGCYQITYVKFSPRNQEK